MHVHVFIRSFACCSYSTLKLSVKCKVSNNIETLNSPTLVQDILQVSEDRRLCVVCKSFAYQIRISKGKIASLVLTLAIFILLASRKCLVTYAVVCIYTSSPTRYIVPTIQGPLKRCRLTHLLWSRRRIQMP